MKVKGRTEATRIFALLGDSAMKHSYTFIELADRHAEFLQKFRAQAWDAAETLSRQCEALDGGRLDRLYALYRERIAFFRHIPPPPNWDGGAEALSK